MLRATTACTFEHLNLNFQTCSENGVFCTFLLRATTVHFFNISTSKSAPNPRFFFLHFGFDMCFVPQRRAIIFLSADHMAPHPPLQRAYFLTLRSHKTLGKIPCFVTFYLFAHLDLLSSDSLIFFLLPFPPDSLTSAFLSIYPQYGRKFDVKLPPNSSRMSKIDVRFKMLQSCDVRSTDVKSARNYREGPRRRDHFWKMRSEKSAQDSSESPICSSEC